MYPGVSLVHMLKSKIESILDNDELALESARDAVALCPEDKSLCAYVDLLEEKSDDTMMPAFKKGKLFY